MQIKLIFKVVSEKVFEIYWIHRLLLRSLYKKRGRELNNADTNLSYFINGLVLISLIILVIPKQELTNYFKRNVTPTRGIFYIFSMVILFPLYYNLSKFFYFYPSKISKIRYLKHKYGIYFTKTNCIIYLLFWLMFFPLLVLTIFYFKK